MVRHIVEECYDIERIMGSLANYFDYEAYGRELFMWDTTWAQTAMCSAASDLYLFME